MEFRQRTINNFEALFGETDEEDTGGNELVSKWGWFGVLYRLTGGEFSKLELITERSLLEALTWLSYELDLNETQKVKYEHRRNKV